MPRCRARQSARDACMERLQMHSIQGNNGQRLAISFSPMMEASGMWCVSPGWIILERGLDQHAGKGIYGVIGLNDVRVILHAMQGGAQRETCILRQNLAFPPAAADMIPGIQNPRRSVRREGMTPTRENPA